MATTYTTAEINQFYERDGIPLWRELARAPEGRDSGMLTFGYWPEGTRDLWTAQHKLLRLVRHAVNANRESIGIDVACGHGGLLMHFAESVGCSMLGINISFPQLEECAARVRACGLEDRVSSGAAAWRMSKSEMHACGSSCCKTTSVSSARETWTIT